MTSSADITELERVRFVMKNGEVIRNAGFQPAGARAPSSRRQDAGEPAAKDGGVTFSRRP